MITSNRQTTHTSQSLSPDYLEHLLIGWQFTSFLPTSSSIRLAETGRKLRNRNVQDARSETVQASRYRPNQALFAVGSNPLAIPLALRTVGVSRRGELFEGFFQMADGALAETTH